MIKVSLLGYAIYSFTGCNRGIWRINNMLKYANSYNNGAKEVNFSSFGGRYRGEHNNMCLVEISWRSSFLPIFFCFCRVLILYLSTILATIAPSFFHYLWQIIIGSAQKLVEKLDLGDCANSQHPGTFIILCSSSGQTFIFRVVSPYTTPNWFLVQRRNICFFWIWSLDPVVRTAMPTRWRSPALHLPSQPDLSERTRL